MIYILEINKLYNESCIKFMQKIPDKSINLIIADPPYFNVVNEDWDNQWEDELNYLDWCSEWLKESTRILTENGSLYVWGLFPTIHSIVHIAKQYFEPLQENIWYKPNGNPIGGSRKFRQLFENCVSFVKDKNNYIFNSEDVREPYVDDYEKIIKKRNKKDIERGYMPNPNGKLRSNVWIYGNQRKQNHFTPKHPEVCEIIVKVASNKNDLVYIPFAGSGSEIKACINNNRRWIATEINQEYINNIKIQ